VLTSDSAKKGDSGKHLIVEDGATIEEIGLRDQRLTDIMYAI
jgi:hypothetical protein